MGLNTERRDQAGVWRAERSAAGLSVQRSAGGHRESCDLCRQIGDRQHATGRRGGNGRTVSGPAVVAAAVRDGDESIAGGRRFVARVHLSVLTAICGVRGARDQTDSRRRRRDGDEQCQRELQPSMRHRVEYSRWLAGFRLRLFGRMSHRFGGVRNRLCRSG